MQDISVERRIVTGLIVSTQYIRRIRSIFDPSLLETDPAKYLSEWCMEYFDQYDSAPYKEIEAIYIDKLKKSKISKDFVEEIQEDILPDLNDDYLEEGINIDYLTNQTKDYFREKRIERHEQKINEALRNGNVEEAERLALGYEPVADERANEIDFQSKEFEERLKRAFERTYERVLEYPGALGDLLNEHLVRGGFVSFMSIEKQGKTWLLLDMAMRAVKQGSKVAFFQAGDMTEDQQLMRMAIYITRRSNKEKYTGEIWEPVRDCIYNQVDDCDFSVRESDVGIFESRKDDLSDYYNWRSFENLKEAYHKVPDYSPCRNCQLWRENKWGAPWLRKTHVDRPLNYQDARDAYRKFRDKHKGRFKMATFDNGTLSVPTIKSRLGIWEKEEGFQADIILIDYADLLISKNYAEFRHRQNDVWMGLRALSQEKHCLVVAPTQADAKAYEQGTLKLSNFSEDKRKYSHVTAMWGLNRDTGGKEKKLGILRINELLIREGEYDSHRFVHVLQNLRRGRPVIASYW